MTPQTGIGAPFPEQQAISELDPFRARLALPADVPTEVRADRETPHASDERIESVVRHDAFNRRLLTLVDIAAASVALVVLLNVFSQRRVAAPALAGIALLLFLFQVAGLYASSSRRPRTDADPSGLGRLADHQTALESGALRCERALHALARPRDGVYSVATIGSAT